MNPVLPVENLLVIFTAVIAAAAVLSWKTSSKCSSGRRILMLVLRLSGFLILSAVAFNPGKWISSSDDKKSEWHVLLDRSASMSVSDVNGGTRWADALRIAGRIRSLSQRPEEIRMLPFSAGIENAREKMEQLHPDGAITDITGAGVSVLNMSRQSGRKNKGVVILSDGRQTFPSIFSDFTLRARSQEVPFYPLLIGGEVPEKNISVAAGRKQYMAFLGHKVKVSANVSSRGFGRIAAGVSLLDSKGVRAAEQKVELDDGERKTVKFEIAPVDNGYNEYVFETPLREGENNMNDNRAGIGVNVIDKKIHILSIEGVPCWDTKFLVQLLRTQSYIDVTSVYRLSSNRFFKVDTDPSKASESSESIFPDTFEELNSYDVVIFGRGAEYFLTEDRIKLLKEFLRERGACVIFSRGKPYSGSLPALESMEPVEWGETVSSPFYFKPAEAGTDTGLFGEMLPSAGDPLWAKMPPLENSSRCTNVKSFSQALAEGVFETDGEGRAFPLVIAQRYGRGIITLINAEGFWKWDFTPSAGDSTNMYREFWLRLIEWNLAFSEFLPGLNYAVKLSDPSAFPDESVRVKVSSRSGDGKSPAPVLNVIKDGGKIMELIPGRTENDRTWESVFSLKETGIYRIEVQGAETSKDILTVKPRPAESDNLSSDPEFMAKIAEGSGGMMIAESDLKKIVSEIEKEDIKIAGDKAVWRSSWNSWWLLTAALALFAFEWILRRRAGLI
ncbi:MAG TPA: hypothetical protein DET40_19280 [Lentisphaeria bacterium]|nr:MAG: hypothetical protein A2X45_18110 [Lentisphaerae bacterium GWF2_50_93]HCE45691.1 hypothetical protein [Lentisphaeria bacterium]